MNNGRGRIEAGWLFAMLLTIGLAASYKLSRFIVADMDEGIYVYAGKLIAEGQRPYRDFMLAHPPLVALTAALFWIVGGGRLEVTRWLTILLTLGSCVPLYLLTRRISGKPIAGLLAVSVYSAGLVWIANLGRTVRLEPLMNALLISGTASWLLGKNRWSGFAAGVLLSGAICVKLVAVVPIACVVFAELLWLSLQPNWPRRAWAALGAALVLLSVGYIFAAEPGFIEWTIRAQAARERDGIPTRLLHLGMAIARYPFLVPAILLAVWQLFCPDRLRRTFALTSVVGLATSVCFFNTFFRHYLAMPLPFLSVLLAVALAELNEAKWHRALRACAFGLALISPIAFTELSLRTAPEHSSGAARVLPFLRARKDFLLTSAPDFALQTRRPLVPGYFIVDNFLGRVSGRMSDSEFAAYVVRAGNVVLYPGEIERLPMSQRALALGFRSVSVGPDWEVWERL